MESTEEQRKAAHLAGISVEEWQRRGQVALSTQKKAAGGFVMSRVDHMNNRVVRMDGSDSGNTALMNSTTPSELATYARKYLDDFIRSGDAADLARSASLTSAALARAARR
jgi:hypothetical protein